MAFVLAVDFDGTIVENDFPNMGPVKQDVVDKVLECKECGAEVILWTCREMSSLDEAIEKCKELGLEWDAINTNGPTALAWLEQNKPEEQWGYRKIYADLYVDDKAPGSIEFFLKIDAQKTCDNFKNR